LGQFHRISTEISTENFTPPFSGIDIHAIGEIIVAVTTTVV